MTAPNDTRSLSREHKTAEAAALQKANEERWASHKRAEVDVAIPVSSGPDLDVVTVNGLVYVGESVLNADQLVTLRQALDAAFQAVQV